MRRESFRPLNPSPLWQEYESRYRGLSARELKEKDPELYRDLRSTDELHFLPTKQDEARPTFNGHSDFFGGHGACTAADMARIVEETAREVGYNLAGARLRPTYVGVIAGNLRSSPRWLGHSKAFSPAGISKGNKYYVHSRELSQEVVTAFIRKQDVGHELLALWINKATARLAQGGV